MSELTGKTAFAPDVNPSAQAAWMLLALFVGAIFLSALLLFWVQPMFAKMVLPMLGGAPAVWNTAMMFFQTMLLAGYAYAHVLSKIRSPRWQLGLHLSLLAAAALTLPLGVAEGWTAPTDGAPILWLAALLAASVGLPFFALSASAPLLQRWFSLSGHAHAQDPYFLYAASNLGSMAGLLVYPLLVEPGLRLSGQSLLWAILYGVLALILVGIALSLRPQFAGRSAHLGPSAAVIDRPPLAARPNWQRRLYWVALTFVPSSLLLGVTQHITTDLAAVPLLWVAPLALYLLSFVIVFARKPLIPSETALLVQPHLLIYLSLFFGVAGNIFLTVPLHLVSFFFIALVCHGQLVKTRPPADSLTEFYLWMSFGGMLGGVFNALVAPQIFNAIYEYPLAIPLACLLRPGHTTNTPRAFALDIFFPLALLGLVWAVLGFGLISIEGFDKAAVGVIFVAVGISVFSFRHRPLRFALGIGVAMLPSVFFLDDSVTLEKARSFFGVYKVQHIRNGEILALSHGTTFHGAELVGEAGEPEPLTYYSRPGPLGQIFAGLESDTRIKNVGVIGLGIGSAACYRKPGQNWTYFEIDPLVVQFAQNETYFHFLSRCGAEARIVLGDGRLSLAREPDGALDLIIVDAFSSDAIPMHLLTKEAMDLYWRKLSPHGLLAIHISNRHLDLAPVLANIIAASGLTGRKQYHTPTPELADAKFHSESIWTLIARTDADLARLDDNAAWTRLLPDASAPLWTDDFSNLIGVIRH
jgi:hypothetical protein